VSEAATPEPATGTGAGLMAFLDYTIARGLMNSNTANSYRAAVKEVLSAAEGDDWESVSVNDLDIEDTGRRFGTLRAMKFKPDSLATYRSRFKSAVSMYKEWQNDPEAWRAPTRERSSRMPRETRSKSLAETPTATVIPMASSPGPASSRSMITYPFPLRDGVLASVMLPPDLTKKEAKRLAGFIESLAIEETPALMPGRPELGPGTEEG